ncbi:MAG: NAD-dependent epimerase/dehydratase family protein, partial [Polyangiaceae bacterium]|nr:NAD-dependent epimerase/dehydratase family protein [Polyangiaceae bacterium]
MSAAAEGPIVITGACGPLGRRLVRHLHRSRHVIALDARPFPECPKDVEHHRFEFWRKRVRDVLKRGHVEAVVHAVGGHDERTPREDRAENVAGFSHLLEH